MELNPQDLVVSFGPTQARAMLGVKDIQHLFAINPDEVNWSFKNNTVSRDTIGGRVVQILSSTVEIMTVSGRAGSRRELQIMSNNLKKIMQYQIKTSEPVNFKVPSRNWDFLVYIQNVSGLGWDVTTTSYPYQISLAVQDDLTGISNKISTKNLFDSLSEGMGYNPKWHGGNLSEATRYIEAMQNALGNVSITDDAVPSPLGDEDGPAGDTRELKNCLGGCAYCVKFKNEVLLTQFSDLKNMGVFNCKRVNSSTDPSDPWSDHAWGAAIDWGNGSPSRMATLFGVCIKLAFKYNITYVIYNKRIWSREKGEHDYNGSNTHENHVHISFVNNVTGNPPCAKT